MKIKYLTILAVLALSACASQPDYKAATGGGYGYKESQISENRYRVQYKARGDARDKAMDYALLRSAELTLLKGYDWFMVVDRETLRDREQQAGLRTEVRNDRVVTRDCGLLGCTTTSRPSTSYGVGIGAGTSPRTETETVLEIRLGKGVRPASGDSYDALEVRDNLVSRD